MKVMEIMKGYMTHTGYRGYIPKMGYILFSTEEEYREYYKENYGTN